MLYKGIVAALILVIYIFSDILPTQSRFVNWGGGLRPECVRKKLYKEFTASKTHFDALMKKILHLGLIVNA